MDIKNLIVSTLTALSITLPVQAQGSVQDNFEVIGRRADKRFCTELLMLRDGESIATNPQTWLTSKEKAYMSNEKRNAPYQAMHMSYDKHFTRGYEAAIDETTGCRTA